MNESIKELARDLKDYIELRFDWIALNASEVLSHLVSIVLQKIFAILLLGIALFFLMFALAQFLGNLMGNGDILLGKSAIVFTVFAIIGGINSFNVMDGIDGLASGLAMIIFGSIFFLASIESNVSILNLSLVYLIILLPFFIFNLTKKNKVFMGDAGTLFIGLGIVWILIISSQEDHNILSPVTALWIYALPLMDSVTTVILRLIKRKSPFLPDLNHIHHQLRKRYDISDLNILIILLFSSILLSIIGVLGQLYSVPEWIMFNSFLILYLVYLLFSINNHKYL